MKFKRSVCIAVGISNLYYTQVILINSNSFAGRKILIGETDIRGKTWKIVIENLRNFPANNNGVVIFTQDTITSVSKFLVREEPRDNLPKRFIMVSTFVVKIFRHGFLSKDDHFFKLAPIFAPEFGPQFAKNVLLRMNPAAQTSDNSPVSHPIMHHFVTEMCTCGASCDMHKWYNVRYGTDALWDLWDVFRF